MTKTQKVYREMRQYLSRADARYAAPRVVLLMAKKALRDRIKRDCAGY